MDGIDRVRPGPAEEGLLPAAVGTGQRQRKRDSLFLSARLSLAGVRGEHEVRVRNLSEGGLMAELDCHVAPGTIATLEMRGLGEMTGRVAWCAHGRMGIALDHPIDPARARTSIGGGKRTPGYAKPLVVTGRRG